MLHSGSIYFLETVNKIYCVVLNYIAAGFLLPILLLLLVLLLMRGAITTTSSTTFTASVAINSHADVSHTVNKISRQQQAEMGAKSDVVPKTYRNKTVWHLVDTIFNIISKIYHVLSSTEYDIVFIY